MSTEHTGQGKKGLKSNDLEPGNILVLPRPLDAENEACSPLYRHNRQRLVDVDKQHLYKQYIAEDPSSILDVTQNTVTEVYKNLHAKFLIGQTITRPTHIALGAKVATATEQPRNFTALKAEFERKEITSFRLQNDETARLTTIFVAREGTGEIREIGLFNASSKTTPVFNADSLGEGGSSGWIAVTDPANIYSINTVDFREGSAAVQSSGSGGSPTFRNSGLVVSTIDGTNRSSDFLQLWYYVSDVSRLTSTPIIEIGSAGDGADEFRFVVTSGTLSNGWNWISRAFSNADTVNGSPNLNSFKRFRLLSPKNAVIQERVDKGRIFRETGDLWARAEPATTVTKGPQDIRGITWYLTTREAGEEVTFIAFDKETLTVTSGVIQLSSAIFSPAGADAARRAFVTIATAKVRYFYDGSTPTGTTGHIAFANSNFELTDISDISNFRVIRDGSESTDAVLTVTYER